ncbi:MAG: pyridoxal phosphate-dependent aminotransferase [Clostridia bacterium]|nr:pyridoxal phosphate-dependent aminotransferase [Clostridia bacterium]
MTRPLSWRSRTITASPTVSLDSRTKELIAAGHDIVSFSVGEPDFPSVPAANEAAKAAIDEGFTKYTAAAGDPRLRQAICEKLRRDQGLIYRPQDIVVSNGAKQSIFQALAAICEEGDEVVLLAPYWVSYPEQVKLVGARPVVVPTTPEDRYHPRVERVAEAITPRTKAIVLNSPNNPSGAVYTERELRDLMELAREHDLWVIADEIYERLVYDGARHVSPATFSEDAYRRTVVVNGMSKAYAMTGWRIGYTACAEPDLTAAMLTIQTQLTSGASSVSQMAALGALRGPDEPVAAMVRTFDERRRAMCAALNEIPGLSVPLPEGAFYVFVDVRAYLGRERAHDGAAGAAGAEGTAGAAGAEGTAARRIFETAEELAEAILVEAGVAVVPGEGFGVPGALRLSYATSMERIEEGMRRLKAFFATWR